LFFLLLFVERYFTSTSDLQFSGPFFCQRQAIAAGCKELAAFLPCSGTSCVNLLERRSGVLSLLVLHTNDSYFLHSHFWMAQISILQHSSKRTPNLIILPPSHRGRTSDLSLTLTLTLDIDPRQINALIHLTTWPNE
jgi:hypothetical protein